MKINILACSDNGCKVALEVANLFEDSSCFSIEKFANKYKNIIAIQSTMKKTGEIFSSSDGIIFIGSCGIATRAIAPHIKSKTCDPAVIVIDDCKNFVIPILSGHIGGANDLAKLIANNINATAVITTATDVNNKFSVDSWATKNNLKISNMKIAMDVSARILQNDVNIKTDFAIDGDLANGLVLADSGDLGVYVSYKNNQPFNKTLTLTPKILHVGIGCKRDTPMETIEKQLIETLKNYNIDINAVIDISSIDLKKDEKGLLSLAKKYNKMINFYSASQLNELKGEFTQSSFVSSITGVDNVCERSSVKACNNKENKVIVKKTSGNGVTIAVTAENWRIKF